MMEHFSPPNFKSITAIVAKTIKGPIKKIDRLRTGLSHYVFKIVLTNGENYVIRIAHPDNLDYLQGFYYWTELLWQKQIPVPRVLFKNFKKELSNYSFVIYRYIEGDDLHNVYPLLSKQDKKGILLKLIEIQNSVATLPQGQGYGWAFSYEDNFPYKTWQECINDHIKQSSALIKETGVFDLKFAHTLEEKQKQFKNYFTQIAPSPFLDDTTTKNVIIHNKKLQCIIDVDQICFGDNLLIIALTKMSLLKAKYDLDYVDLWCEELKLNTEQLEVLNFYTALFCLRFMSEIGQSFNKDEIIEVDKEMIRHLLVISKTFI